MVISILIAVFEIYFINIHCCFSLSPSHKHPIPIKHNIPVSFFSGTDIIAIDIKDHIARFFLACTYQFAVDIKYNVTRSLFPRTDIIAVDIEYRIARSRLSCTDKVAVKVKDDIFLFRRRGYRWFGFGNVRVVLVAAARK